MKNNSLDSALLNNFSGIKLKSPLFYNSKVGIRFEMGGHIEDPQKRIQQIKHRAVTLFNEINQINDDVYFVLFMDSWEEHPVSSFEEDVLKVFEVFINGLDVKQIFKSVEEYRYKDVDEEDNTVTIRYFTELKVKDLNIDRLIFAIANQNVGNEVSSIIGDIFLVNKSKNLMFYLYDGRGLDIVSQRKETLRNIYEKYNDWILDFDREKIKKIFNF